ncbi:coA-transferase family III domain-containing protein [Ditylenchus destructor]|nr:coA-transferase family III domain-containing protein [Ditylenchus destructor]
MATQLLKGIKVVELAGLAPVPFCGMILADYGADVTLVLNKSSSSHSPERRLDRGKTTVSFDFKTEISQLKKLCLNSDVLLDPFRPGVLENIGINPVALLQENKKLIIARLTGYGQTGPLAHKAGHDINYVALSGLLPYMSGDRKPYWPPANLLADFAGGSLLSAFAIVAAIYDRTKNGNRGCILDCSMTEGLAYLGSFISLYQDVDLMWNGDYGAFSSKSPIYRTYETKDGKWIAVGALEPKFSAQLFETLGINKTISEMFSNPAKLALEMENKFKTKTLDEWMEIFKDKDACVTPVLNLDSVGAFEHHVARQTFENIEGKWIPKPAPRHYTLEKFPQLKISKQKSKL